MPKAPAPAPKPLLLADAAEGRTNAFKLRRKFITPRLLPDGSRLNVRIDWGDLDTLARSIATHGIRKDLLGSWHEGMFHFDDGERRMKAFDLAVEKHGLDPDGDLGLIPVDRQPTTHTARECTLDMLTCNAGKDFTPWERALVIHRLHTLGDDDKAIAAAVPCSITHVADCLRLVTAASKGLQEAVSGGLISFTLASELAREVTDLEGQDDALAQARAAAAEAGSERITARHLPVKTGKAAQASRNPAPAPEPPPAFVKWDGLGGHRQAIVRGQHRHEEDSFLALYEYDFHGDTLRGRRELPEEERPEPTAPPLTAEDRELLAKCLGIIRQEEKASIALFQRRLHLGYTKAASLVQVMIAQGILGESKDGLVILADSVAMDRWIELLERTDTADPFDGKACSAPYLDDAGKFIDELRSHPCNLGAKGVAATVLLGCHLGAWYPGFILKWPGQSKDDGYLKIDPTTRAKSYPCNALAELAALQAMHGELESKAKFDGQSQSLAELDARIRTVAATVPEQHRPAAASTPATPPAASAPLPNPVLPPDPSKVHGAALQELDSLIADVPAADAEKDRLRTLKVLRGLLAGKHERKEVVKYLIGIVEKVDVVKGGAK